MAWLSGTRAAPPIPALTDHSVQRIAAQSRGARQADLTCGSRKEPTTDGQVSLARPCPMVGRGTGGATMNKAVMKLPLMLGVVGAIAFAAATPSWAAEQKGPNAAAGVQAGTQIKATGSSAKMSADTNAGANTKMSTGRAASSEGMRTGRKLSKDSQLSSRTHMGSGRAHLSSKEGARTRTHIGVRESLRTRTSVGLREARFRHRGYETDPVGVGIDAGFDDTD